VQKVKNAIRKNKAQPVRAQTFTLSEHLIRAQNLV